VDECEEPTTILLRINYCMNQAHNLILSKQLAVEKDNKEEPGAVWSSGNSEP
jgi:hypothetical protein